MRAPLRKLRLLWILAVFFLITPVKLNAYYDDFHYAFTYYIARAVGYTPQQAHRVASADVSVDYDHETEPVQDEWQLRWLSSRSGSLGLSSGNQEYAARAQQPRIDFHAFMDCLNVPSCLENAAAAAVIPQKRAQLEARARESGNPGSLLHFVQDEVPHAGYPSDNGHWTALDATSWNAEALPLGATTDFVSYPGASGNQGPMVRNRPGVTQTVDILVAAMRGTFRGKPIHQKPRNYNWSSDIAPAFKAIVDANPTPARTASQALEEAASDPERPIYMQLWEFYSVWKSESSPILERALGAVNHMLRSTLKAKEQIPGSWIVYNLNEQGVPAENDRDNWVLWGDLNIRLDIRKQGEEVGKSYKPAKIEIQLVPTYQGAKEEKIAEATVQTTEGITIENLPIGELVVEMRFEDNKPQVQKVNLLRQKQTVSFKLDLDKEEKEQKSIDELLALLERMRELEKKSNEAAAEAEAALAELQKELSSADAGIGAVISELSLWMEKVNGWKSQIAALEASLAGREALMRRAAEGKQKAVEAEGAAKNSECPPQSVIEEGTEEDRKVHIQKAESLAQNLQKLVPAAESGALQARAAADELLKLQAEGERLSAEIQGANAGALFEKLTAAGESLARAETQLDGLMTITAALESYKNEADEIMELARKMIHDFGDNQDLHKKLDELSSEFAALYKTISGNFEKWKNVPAENRKKAEEFRAQIKELEARVQALSGEIAGLAVPAVDGGSAIADAEVAAAAAAGVKAAAQTAAECPEKIAAVELQNRDKITGLEIELEIGPVSDDGTMEYAVNAVVTVTAKAQVMVLCEGSHNPGHKNGTVGGLDDFRPETFRNPLARGDFKPGDSVTVTCHISGQENKTVSKTVTIKGADLAGLIQRMEQLRASAEAIESSAKEVAKRAETEAENIIGEVSENERGMIPFAARMGDLESAARTIPEKVSRAADAAARAARALQAGLAAAGEFQAQSAEVCRLFETARNTEAPEELQNYYSQSMGIRSALINHGANFKSARLEAEAASQEAQAIDQEVAYFQDRLTEAAGSGESARWSAAAEAIKAKLFSLQGARQALQAKKQEFLNVIHQARQIVSQSESSEDKKGVEKIGKIFKKIQDKEPSLNKMEAGASEIISRAEVRAGEFAVNAGNVLSKEQTMKGLLAGDSAGGKVRTFAERAKADYEQLAQLREGSVGQAHSQAEQCLKGIEGAASQALSPEAQVARKDCSGYPNTVAAWSSEANAPHCVCIQGYELTPDRSGCQLSRQETLRQTDCSGYPGTVAVWDESINGPRCVCQTGMEWNGTYCVSAKVAQVQNTNCSHIYGASAYWDEGLGKPMCACPSGQVIENNRCVVYQAPQQIQPDCSAYPGTVAVWDNSINNYRCNCPAGSQWNGSSCIQPDWGRVISGLADAFNQGVRSNTPSTNTYPTGHWGSDSGGTPVPTQLPGLGSSGGSSGGGGTYAGFTGFGGQPSTPTYTPPSSGTSPGVNTAAPNYTRSPGVNTDPGDPCVTVQGRIC